MSFRWKVGLGLAGAIFVALLVLGFLRYLDRVEAAERADARADSALRVAKRDSATADSVLAVLGSVQERERNVRDSLNLALREAGRHAESAQAAVDTSRLRVSSALDTLARRVRPELAPVVARARAGLDSLSAAHRRFRRAMEARVALLASDTLSLHRELMRTRTALDTVAKARDSWRDAYREIEEARNRWREAARLRLFGLPPEVTHAVAAGVGYGLGKL